MYRESCGGGFLSIWPGFCEAFPSHLDALDLPLGLVAFSTWNLHMGQTPAEGLWHVLNVTLLVTQSEEGLLNHCTRASTEQAPSPQWLFLSGNYSRTATLSSSVPRNKEGLAPPCGMRKGVWDRKRRPASVSHMTKAPPALLSAQGSLEGDRPSEGGGKDKATVS